MRVYEHYKALKEMYPDQILWLEAGSYIVAFDEDAIKTAEITESKVEKTNEGHLRTDFFTGYLHYNCAIIPKGVTVVVVRQSRNEPNYYKNTSQ